MTLVLDASVLIWAVTSNAPATSKLRRRLVAEDCHAPHLIDAEVGNVLRRQVRRGQLSAVHGEVLLTATVSLIDHRYGMTGPLARTAWELRENLSFYDALYAALAQALDAPLLTCDERLGRASGLPCVVEVIGS